MKYESLRLIVTLTVFTFLFTSACQPDLGKISTLGPQFPEKPVSSSTIPVEVRTSPTQMTTSTSTLHGTPTIRPSSIPQVTSTSLASSGPPDFRITYQNTQGDIITLYPPYDQPQLLFHTDPNESFQVLFPVSWSHDGHRMAFVKSLGDEKNLALFIYNDITNEVFQVSQDFGFDNHLLGFFLDWSKNDRWLSLIVDDGFITSLMFDLLTQNTYSLESLSQDEFTSWSPVVDDEYAYISRPNFPEAGGDLLCIGKIDRDEPVQCIDQFDDYSLSSGNQFSWKLDGNNAFILAGNDTGTYYLEIDFLKNQVTPTISIDGYQLTNFWSPDDRWIVFYGLYPWGGSLTLFETSFHNLRTIVHGEYGVPSPLPEGWAWNGGYLFFTSGYLVYAIKPSEPEKIILIEDFTSILGWTDIFQIDMIE